MSTILRSASRFLVEYAHLLLRGLVLDVAAGSGRNTIYLAEHGFTVHAIDRNPEALIEVQLTARDRRLMHVTTEVVDLEGEPFSSHVFPPATYDVVIVFFYLFRPLFPALVRTLKPDGVLMYETFLIDNYLRSGITQESKSAIRCWCYGQHQHCNNPCDGNVPDKFIVPQYTDELCELSQTERSTVARHPAAGSLSEGSLVSTAVGILCADARAEGRLFDH